MSIPLDAPEVLEREFLPIRAKILEIAAALDRLDRAEGAVADDPRMAQLRRALETLERGKPDRAEQIQLIFSQPYEGNWRQTYALGK